MQCPHSVKIVAPLSGCPVARMDNDRMTTPRKGGAASSRAPHRPCVATAPRRRFSFSVQMCKCESGQLPITSTSTSFHYGYRIDTGADHCPFAHLHTCKLRRKVPNATRGGRTDRVPASPHLCALGGIRNSGAGCRCGCRHSLNPFPVRQRAEYRRETRKPKPDFRWRGQRPPPLGTRASCPRQSRRSATLDRW